MVWRFFDRQNITSKKSLHASERERADVRRARASWKRKQPRLDPKKLIFIDETGTSTNMTRLRGRCRRGQRLVAQVPHGHWKILRQDRISPPFVDAAPAQAGNASSRGLIPRFRDLAERADRGDAPVQQHVRDRRAVTQEERTGRNGYRPAGRVVRGVQRGGVVGRLTRHLDQERGEAKSPGGLGRRIGLVSRRRIPLGSMCKPAVTSPI